MKLSPYLIAAAAFLCLSLASIATMCLHPRLPPHHRSDESANVIRLVANIFVVIASLVFGLMINSSKNTFETIDRNVHGFATDLILLDRMLRAYGSEADAARGHLVSYVQAAIASPARADENSKGPPNEAGLRLEMLGSALARIYPADRNHESLLTEARQQYRRIVEQRWTIIEESEGTIPLALIAMLIAWLTLIFASFGYRAPPNATVITLFLIAAFLIAASLYLILDMDVPFAGPIQISDMPLRRALAEMND